MFTNGGGDWSPKMGFLCDVCVQLPLSAPQEWDGAHRSLQQGITNEGKPQGHQGEDREELGQEYVKSQ